MAKKRETVSEPDTLELKYDLFSLPTAQHKAGLVGLLLMIESMKARKLSPLPEVSDLTATGVRVTLTHASMRATFDDLFDAYWSEEERPQKLTRKDGSVIPFKREVTRDIIDRDGKTKTKKHYVYDMFYPAGKFLAAYYPDGDGVWLKLWRDMIWNVLRGKPASRGVYEERAGERTKDGNPGTPRPSSEAERWWKLLHKAQKSRAKGIVLTEGIASSVFVGAQDVSAERVPFQGVVEDNFLLNFWPVAAQVYVPRRTKVDGETEDVGHVLVMAEPSSLDRVAADMQNALRSLDTAAAGYLPRAALISLPAEGELEYLHHFVHHRVSRGPLRDSLAAVEAYHVRRRDKSTSLLAAERILPDERVLRDYETLRQQCRNPLYRSQRITNLLHGEKWYQGMESVFSQYPREFFVWKTGKEHATPRNIPFFGLDARTKFRAIESNLKQIGGQPMTEQDKDDLLAQRVYRLVQEYVRRRTEEKSGEKYDKFKTNRDEKGRVNYPQKYREALERVSSDVFLAMRGRRDKDFVEYFTGTVCSVPQFLPENDYLSVAKALIDDWSSVKALAMLAVSACSYLGGAKEETEES